MVPLWDPSFFARNDCPLCALRPERGLASARRSRCSQRRVWTVSSCCAARGGLPSRAAGSPAANPAAPGLAFGLGGPGDLRQGESFERRVVERDPVAPELSALAEEALAEWARQLGERAPARLGDLLGVAGGDRLVVR